MPQADSKNSSGQEQQQTAQTVPYPFPYPQQIEDKTIDLYDLLITLWNRKWLVIAVTVAAALGSVVYALQQTPVTVYKVEALLLPPTNKDIQSLLKIIDKMGGLNVHSPDKIFAEFKKNLNLTNHQNIFFKKQGLIEYLATELNPETSVENFHQIISNLSVISEEENNVESRISISTKFKIPINFTKWLNSYIEFVEIKTIRELVEQIRNSIQKEITSTKKIIISNQEEQNEFFRNRILTYEEAAQVALELGIKERVDSSFSSPLALDYRYVVPPLYYRGYRALNVEIEILKKRFWDLPNKKEIIELEKKITRLSSIEIMEEDFQIVNIGRSAYQTKTIISTNIKRIIALSIVLGLLSGIFLAFFIEFVQNQRKKYSE